MPWEKRLQGKSVYMLAEDLYEDLELWYPLLRLKEEGAEVVAGKNVTCFFASKDDLVHAGATYRDAEVVVDGNLITSRRPAGLPAFLGAIIAGLGGEARCPACQKVLSGGRPEA